MKPNTKRFPPRQLLKQLPRAKMRNKLNKKRRRNFVSSSPLSLSPSPIEELHDDLLINILSRLPDESAYAAKCVSKRWSVLISDPSFLVRFSERNNRSTNLASTFIIRIETDNETSSFITVSDDGKLLLPNFTLNFLPCRVKVAATFKDLVLCYNCTTGRQKIFHICNPFTKQWLTLPPSPSLHNDQDEYWTTLVCEEPRHNVLDYKFRVVILYAAGINDVGFLVFDSETRQWKKKIAGFPWPRRGKNPFHDSTFKTAVTCNKMVNFVYGSSLCEFDPFSFTSTFLTLKCPGWTNSSMLADFEGRLLLVEANGISGRIRVTEVLERRNSHRWCTWTDCIFLNELPHGEAILDRFEMLGMHPSKKGLIYLFVENQGLVSCNLRSKKVKRLSSFRVPSGCSFFGDRLEIQSSPTPLPVMQFSEHKSNVRRPNN